MVVQMSYANRKPDLETIFETYAYVLEAVIDCWCGYHAFEGTVYLPLEEHQYEEA